MTAEAVATGRDERRRVGPSPDKLGRHCLTDSFSIATHDHRIPLPNAVMINARRIVRSIVAVAAACAVFATNASADSLAVVPPLSPGPYPVACNDVAQDFSKLAPGEDVETYWEGVPRADGSTRYVTDLLSEASSSIVLSVSVPDDGNLYGNFAQQYLPVVVLVCYPTAASNTRADYALPTGRTVPHMQRAADAPIWPDATSLYPVLLFSSGLGGSPLSDDYIDALEMFASYGYVVVAPFHGDARVADLDLSGFENYRHALANYKQFIAMQSLRPLSLKFALDAALAHPDFAGRVDPARIGGFGASLGGESLVLMTGARLTTTLGQSSSTVLTDPRLKAIVGYVPYFGQSFYPAFGRDQEGLDGIDVPFLGISGTADTTAPVGTTADGVNQLTGSRMLVELVGTTHEFDFAAEGDIFTWSVTFLAAQAQDDRLARAKISRMTSVAGGGNDIEIIDYTAPAPALADESVVVEYHNAALNHYFLTADPAEAAMLDAGVVVPGWTRTEFDFKAWPVGGKGLSVCRFFGTPSVGPSSHFYTIDPAECAKVKNSQMCGPTRASPLTRFPSMPTAIARSTS